MSTLLRRSSWSWWSIRRISVRNIAVRRTTIEWKKRCEPIDKGINESSIATEKIAIMQENLDLGPFKEITSLPWQLVIQDKKYRSANKVYWKAGHSAFLVMDNSSQVGRFDFSKLRNVIVIRWYTWPCGYRWPGRPTFSFGEEQVQAVDMKLTLSCVHPQKEPWRIPGHN
jgi:hypothetical protein